MAESMGELVCDLAEALDSQEIDANAFLPFAIRCLQAGDPQVTRALIRVRVLRRDTIERNQALLIQWAAGSIPSQPAAVQPHTVTEWGALGVACAILHSLGEGLRLTSVAREGDRFDYWVGDDRQEWGLEVSGTEAESLQVLHESKVRQLLSNPYGGDGFVIVVRFASQEAWFTFHKQPGRST